MSRNLMVMLAVLLTTAVMVGCSKNKTKTIEVKEATVESVEAGDVKTGEVKTGQVKTGDVKVKKLEVDTITVNKVVIQSNSTTTLAMTEPTPEPKPKKKAKKKPMDKKAVDKLCRGCPKDVPVTKLPEICDEAVPYVGKWQAVNTGDGVVAKGEYDATFEILRDGTFVAYRSNSVSEYPKKLKGTWVFDYAKQAVELEFEDGVTEWVKIDKYNPNKLNSTMVWSGPLTFFKMRDLEIDN